MKLDLNGEKAIYLQIASSIEDDVLKNIFEEEQQVMSTTEISVNFKINPATAAKGVNLLVNEGILYKKRGVGMFVAQGAKNKILIKRKEEFYHTYIISLIEEANKLGISKEEIMNMIERSKAK